MNVRILMHLTIATLQYVYLYAYLYMCVYMYVCDYMLCVFVCVISRVPGNGMVSPSHYISNSGKFRGLDINQPVRKMLMRHK